MSGSQVFYMGDNGEVVLWDGTTTIETANYCVTEQASGSYSPSGDNAPSTDGCGAHGDTGPPGEGNPNLPVGWFLKQMGDGAVRVGCAADPTIGPIDYDIGYAQALKDVLEHCIREGKQNLVQWLEGRLKDLP